MLTLLNALQPLYIVNILIGMTLAFCVSFVAAGQHRDLMVWASGFALYALAFALFGLRTEIPPFLSVVGGNAAMAIMFAMFSEGLCRLYGFSVSRWIIWVMPALAVVAFAWYHDDFERRVQVGVVVSSYHSLLVLYLIIRSVMSGHGRGRWIIFAAVATYALMFLFRSILVVSGVSRGDGFLAPGIEQSIYFSIAAVSIVMFAIGLLVIYKEKAEAVALQQAHNDPLTAIGNRRVLKQRLQELSGRPTEGPMYCALLLLDLDHFKDLNDTYGHALGDQLLVHVAERLKRCVNHTDTVIRLGGDEFVVILDHLGCDESEARSKSESVARRILDQICQPYRLKLTSEQTNETEDLNYRITVSVGVALFSCRGFNHEDVLRQADIAMYNAKRVGRNTYHLDICQHDSESTAHL
ncbi:GGDEF domain-containing protein [Pseudohongiella spirulinae]|uniref:GGDEF domain-containing protein n=1 Tax=Pseudohongiella spirulinae TaxID=1249552 RepID=A0A0S2KC00_9GAMM|nr:GGDEF domain-containing protein [Pseudohongiella spirulinae]ALO45737.1 hypothetical protein PS2015_1073 [Pseudohongiella spirulinae]